MTESSLGVGPGDSRDVPPPTESKRGRLGRILLAVVLSLFIGGLGQIYARRIRRGLFMAILEIALGFAFLKSHLLFTFSGLLICSLVRILFHLFIVIDAGSCASPRRLASFIGTPRPKLLTAAAVLGTLLLQVYPIPDYLLKASGFGAFKVSSASMCPTICEGDRIVADRTAFANSRPARGDIMMMKHPSSEALFIKRVIGIEGDLVTQTQGDIFVNGQPLAVPEYRRPGCGERSAQALLKDSQFLFQPMKVPAHSFFVVGDNLANSYDSRIEGFGFVDQSQLRGKPLFIYWSWTRSRIGCQLQ
jgi:signal peptidase I